MREVDTVFDHRTDTLKEMLQTESASDTLNSIPLATDDLSHTEEDKHDCLSFKNSAEITAGGELNAEINVKF